MMCNYKASFMRNKIYKKRPMAVNVTKESAFQTTGITFYIRSGIQNASLFYYHCIFNPKWNWHLAFIRLMLWLSKERNCCLAI